MEYEFTRTKIVEELPFLVGLASIGQLDIRSPTPGDEGYDTLINDLATQNEEELITLRKYFRSDVETLLSGTPEAAKRIAERLQDGVEEL